ncbi:MAG: efflux RND transporter permease subunit [Rudaea sp.]|nr:efflux RND transporter permease subunit [Rudaea sp.]
MTLAELSLKRPVTVIMVFVSMTVVGLIAAFRLPLELVPDFQAPFLDVVLPYPGSTPSEIERTITRPVEDALATLTGVQRISSLSSADSSQISLGLKFGQDTSLKAIEALGKIDAIRKDLPNDLPRFYVQKYSTGATPVLVLAVSSDRDLTYAYELLDSRLRKPLERVPGIAKVELLGALPREVQIAVSSDRLNATGVSLTDLYQKLSAANFSATAGLISDRGQRLQVRPVGEWQSVDEIRRLVLDASGVRLGDVADVGLRPARADYRLLLDEHPSIVLVLQKERAANIVDVSRAALAELNSITASSDMHGIRVVTLWDAGKSITESLRQLGQAGFEGTLLSIFVLFFFLRDWPSTMMVSLSIPICFIITLGCMQMFGITLNLLSMMGLLLAVGMLVDNAVVVVESIYHFRERYPDRPWYCAVQGTQIVGIAIAAGTLCSVIVFLPLVFGEPNQFKVQLFQIAVSMAIAHLSSWRVAISLVPMLSAKLPPPKFIGRNGLVARMLVRYGRWVGWTLSHRRWTMLGLLLLMVASAIPIGATKVDMNGDSEPSMLHFYYRFNGFYTLDEMNRGIAQVESYLSAHRDAFHIRNMYTSFNEAGQASTDIYLDTGRGEKLDIKKIQQAIRDGMPKLAIGEVLFSGDNGRSDGGNSMGIALIGDSRVALEDLARNVVQVLQQQPSLRDVRTSTGSSNQEIAIHVDRERAKTYGFSANDIARHIAIALRGQQLKDFHGSDAQVPVWLRFAQTDTRSLADLAGFKVRNAEGVEVPLMAMVQAQAVQAPAAIERINRQTSLGIVANRADGKTSDDARRDIERAMSGITLPAGYRWNFGESFDLSEEGTRTMLFNVLVALVLVYVVMCAMFESLIYPAAILTTFVFSVLGIYWFFWITGTVFTFMSFIGVLILMGVVVNNGIVMIVHINHLRHNGLVRRDALVQGAKDRLRPILMTMGTAILGMVPLCFEGASLGGDGPQYYPMARAIVGGLVFSTLVSLLVLPTIYSLLDDMSRWSKCVLADARASRLPQLRSQTAPEGIGGIRD